jgi:hypothetical protein
MLITTEILYHKVFSFYLLTYPSLIHNLLESNTYIHLPKFLSDSIFVSICCVLTACYSFSFREFSMFHMQYK